MDKEDLIGVGDAKPLLENTKMIKIKRNKGGKAWQGSQNFLELLKEGRGQRKGHPIEQIHTIESRNTREVCSGGRLGHYEGRERCRGFAAGSRPATFGRWRKLRC